MWNTRDNVFLVEGLSKKGYGIIHCIDPNEMCGLEQIGDSCVSVHVMGCIDATYKLPFPTMDASTMSEAVGSLIKWPRDMLLKDGSACKIHLLESPCSGKGKTSKPQQLPVVDRASWRQQRVHLWNLDVTQKLGEGVVFLVNPDDVINFNELGERHLGVIIERPLHGSMDLSESQYDLPQLNLVRWPIKQITFENGEPLLLIESSNVYDDLENDLDCSNLQASMIPGEDGFQNDICCQKILSLFIGK